MINIGINGFGRIGRLAFRTAIDRPHHNVVAINDLQGIDYIAYALKYDSAHGKFKGEIEVKGQTLVVNGHPILITRFKEPERIPWGQLNTDFVIEATGLFTKKEQASRHLEGGAKHVVISAPSEDAPMVVMGVNHFDLSPHELVFSNASCTTNCLAPVVKLLNDNFGIEAAFVSTIHAATSSQSTVDAPRSKWRRGRSALNNIIPTSTMAAEALSRVMPAMKGKIKAMAFRVPTVDVSLIDMTIRVTKPTTYNTIKDLMKEASETTYKGILGYTDAPVVSQDFISETRTSVFDAEAGMELNPHFFKIVAWYDNEFGYATKLIDLIEYAYVLNAQNS